jgi:predicted small lipoprotein YifL
VRASFLVVAVLVAGCPKKGPSQPPPATVTCDNVGQSIAAQLAEDVKSSPDVDPHADAINSAVVAAVVESCNKDAWTEAARTCFIDARADGGEACRTEISDAQVQALADRMDSAVAKAAPAECSELGPLIVSSLAEEIAQEPPDRRDALKAKIDAFATEIGTQCAAGWTVEARTCFRDASRAQDNPARCARWLDESQAAAYQASVMTAFGAPPSDQDQH